MELTLKRIYKGDKYTIGNLYINGTQKFCDTLEDTDRSLDKSMSIDEIKSIKQPSITAIPTGKYSIAMDIQSPKFKHYKQYAFCDGYLPRLVGVPGFDGILIHIGNKPEDSDGCILVGKNKVKGQVINSTKTFKELYSVLKNAVNNHEEIIITIE